MVKATQLGDVGLLGDPALPFDPKLRAALLKGYRAVASRDAAAKTQAVQALLALPQDQQDATVARLLADLGADHEAFRVAARVATTEYPGPTLLWYPNMRATLFDPGFPALAKQLGLVNYWTTTHTRPDVCNGTAPPPFCRMI